MEEMRTNAEGGLNTHEHDAINETGSDFNIYILLVVISRAFIILLSYLIS